MPFDSSLVHLQRPMQQGRPRLNYDVVQRLNVRALWSFYESGGGVLHDLVGGQDIPVVEDGGSTIDWVPGKIGGPVWSAADDGYASFPGTSFFAPMGDGNPLQYTISAWMLATAKVTTNFVFSIGKVGDNRGIQLGVFGNPRELLFNNVGLQIARVLVSGLDYEAGRWHLLTATAEADFASRLYLDGKLVDGPNGSAAGQNTIPDNGVISGNSFQATFDDGWDGELAQIMYCDRGLLAEEVAELFNPATRWDIYSAPGPVSVRTPVLGSVNILSPFNAFTLAGQIPAVGTSALVAAPLGMFALAGLAPSVAAGAAVATPLQAFSLAGLAPSSAGPVLGAPNRRVVKVI